MSIEYKYLCIPCHKSESGYFATDTRNVSSCELHVNLESMAVHSLDNRVFHASSCCKESGLRIMCCHFFALMCVSKR